MLGSVANEVFAALDAGEDFLAVVGRFLEVGLESPFAGDVIVATKKLAVVTDGDAFITDCACPCHMGMKFRVEMEKAQVFAIQWENW